MKPAIALLAALALGTALGVVAGAQSASGRQPAATVRPVTETLHGVTVTDPYRWMESGGDEFTNGLKAQDAYTRSALDRIPGREKLLARMRQLDQAVSRVGVERLPGDRYLLLKQLGEDTVDKLYARQGLEGKDKLLVDPGKITLAAAGRHLRRQRTFSLVIVSLLCLSAQSPGAVQQKALAIVHATVIDMTGAPPRPDTTVVISGKFLSPGLWDMDVHWYHKCLLPLFIANGVTGIRIMFGFAMHHEWREEIEAGTVARPADGDRQPDCRRPETFVARLHRREQCRRRRAGPSVYADIPGLLPMLLDT